MPYRLGVANIIASDLLWKVEILLLPFTLSLDWIICSVKRKHICILEIQYTGYKFDTATLVVFFLGLKISCSIKIVPEVTINNSGFEFAVSTQS